MRAVHCSHLPAATAQLAVRRGSKNGTIPRQHVRAIKDFAEVLLHHPWCHVCCRNFRSDPVQDVRKLLRIMQRGDSAKYRRAQDRRNRRKPSCVDQCFHAAVNIRFAEHDCDESAMSASRRSALGSASPSSADRASPGIAALIAQPARPASSWPLRDLGADMNAGCVADDSQEPLRASDP